MKNIEIELEINGEIKRFVCTKVKGILLRKTVSVIKVFTDMDKGMNEENLDKLVDYMVDVFEKQFTREEFYNGVELDDVIVKIQKTAENIMEMVTSKIKN
jgi:hypothetical protein